MSQPDRPTMPYWHVYTDAEGVSRQGKFALTAFELKGIGPGVAPQWNDRMAPSPAGVPGPVLLAVQSTPVGDPAAPPSCSVRLSRSWTVV